MATVGQGRIIMWEGASLWILASSQADASVESHAHHAIQITFRLAGSFELEADGRIWSDPVVAVRSDARHIFRAHGAVAFLFIEPESAVGAALGKRLFGMAPVAAWTGAEADNALEMLRRCFLDGIGEVEMGTAGRAIVAALSNQPNRTSPRPVDSRIVRMIAYAAAHLEDGTSLSSAAGHVALSPSRARHLFVAETGLAFKSYLLWLRLERAVGHYAAGASLTDAAHLAGFADSAHFSRTFRRTFGLPAAALRVT